MLRSNTLKEHIKKVLHEIIFDDKGDIKKELKLRFVQSTKPSESESFLKKFIYTFRTPKYKYNAYLEQYEYDFFLVSFRPKLNKDFYVRQQMKAYRGEKYYDEYTYLTKENIPLKVLKLMIQIMKDTLKDYPNASFGYFGAPDIKSGEDTDLFNTKRVRIYNEMLANEFKNTHTLVSAIEYSGGLLLDKEVIKEYPEIKEFGELILSKHL